MPGERGAAGAPGVKGEKVSSESFHFQVKQAFYSSCLFHLIPCSSPASSPVHRERLDTKDLMAITAEMVPV